MATYPNSSKKQHRLLGYFRDDQIMLLVTHTDETISDDLLREVKNRIEARLGDDGKLELMPEVLPQRFSFPAIKEKEGETKVADRLADLKRLDGELKKKIETDRIRELPILRSALKKELEKKGEDSLHQLHRLLLVNDHPSSAYQPQPFNSAFSFLVFNLKKPPDDPRDILLSIVQLRAALMKEEPIRIEIKPREERPVLFESETVMPSEENVDHTPVFEELRIEGILPHWAMSVASNGSGTGGPGGLPRPFQGEDIEAKYEFDIRKTLGKLKIGKNEDKNGDIVKVVGEGEDVDVVVLDTAPCSHALAMAPKNWPHNELIQGLLGQNGILSVESATLDELRRMDNASLNRHDYEMSDHGFFIAGIIHSIVPKAKIHLVEVLNQWGIGDFQSLVTGLEKARDRIYQSESGRRVLVNCSWMLDLPLTENHCSLINLGSLEEDLDHDLHLNNPDYAFELAVLHFALKEREQASDIWAICNSISLAGGKVIAAAGNDWGVSKKGREARKSFQAGMGGKTPEPRVEAPEARFPAGYVSTIGVGALPKETKAGNAKKHRASDYSNKGDRPEVQAIMTLGGEEEDEEIQGGSQREKQKENPRKYKGVLGLYLSDTYPVEIKSDPPKYIREFEIRTRDETKKEKNPWASWAGTSFATPIITGTIAAVLSSSTTPERMIQKEIKVVLDALYGRVYGNPEFIENGKNPDKGTEVNEDVLVVKQGEEETQHKPKPA